MINLLFYGGCHALVLHDCLRAAFPDEIDSALLINFELIAAERPFPFEILDRLDFVVFSPIENKGAYNTAGLVEACAARGVQVICFPWMEWHGYCPGAIKGTFKGRRQWYYKQLVERAATFEGDFDAFCDDVLDTFPDDDVIDAVLECSTDHLRSKELRHDMPVSISDFVACNYRNARLFLISDHPSHALYLHLLRQILDLIGIKRREANARLAALPTLEPQWRWRTPIFPRVTRRLGLRFEDTAWRDDEVIPDREVSLRTYLSLYYNRDSVILGPKGAAPIFIADRGRVSDTGALVADTTRLLADPLPEPAPDNHARYRLLQTMTDDLMIAPPQHFAVDPRQWRSTWF